MKIRVQSSAGYHEPSHRNTPYSQSASLTPIRLLNPPHYATIGSQELRKAPSKKKNFWCKEQSFMEATEPSKWVLFQMSQGLSNKSTARIAVLR